MEDQSSMPTSLSVDLKNPDQSDSIIRDSNVQPTSNGPTLHAELVSIIVFNLQQDRLYATLAKMAQANSTFYNLVIPKLYETVTVTEWSLPRLKYGHDTCRHRPREVGVGIEMNSTGTQQTRKDRAVEHCLRLIIDIPYEFDRNLIDSVIRRKRHEHYNNVYEVVYTTRFFQWDSKEKAKYCKTHHDFPPPTYQESSDAGKQISRIVRVVLHLPLHLDQVDWGCLYGFIDTSGRRTVQDDLRFVVHGVSSDLPSRDICPWAKLKADCYFAANPIPPRKKDWNIGLMIADWFWDVAMYHRSGGNGLRLFDVTDLILKTTSGSPPQDRVEATREARRILRQHLRLREAAEDEEGITKYIMKRVQLCDSGADKVKYEEECPVSRPKQLTERLRYYELPSEGESDSDDDKEM